MAQTENGHCSTYQVLQCCNNNCYSDSCYCGGCN